MGEATAEMSFAIQQNVGGEKQSSIAERIRVLERTVRQYQEREDARARANVTASEKKFKISVFCAVIATLGLIGLVVYVVIGAVTDGTTDPPTRDSLPENTTTTTTNQTQHTTPSNQTQYNTPGVSDPALLTWEQVGSDILGENKWDLFGASTAISADGSRIMVGAHSNDDVGDKSGHVRVFDWSVELDDWVQIGTSIDGENAADESGRSVAMSADGTRIVVGARLNSGSGDEAGHVRVFDWDDMLGDWLQAGDDIDGENPMDEFGRSVAISADGRRIASGADENSDTGDRAGHVRVFEWDEASSNWVQVGTDIDGSNAEDRSGWDVALSADGVRLAVASPWNNKKGFKAGETRMFSYQGAESWVLLGDAVVGEIGGGEIRSVTMSADGARVALGSPFIYNRAGHVRVFDWDDSTGTWVQVGSNIDGENEGDEFGNSISMSADGNRIVVGAAKNDNNGNEIAGHARVFDYNDELLDWVQVGPALTGTNGNEKFGVAVRLSGDGQAIVVGAPDGAGGYGYARVYVLKPGRR